MSEISRNLNAISRRGDNKRNVPFVGLGNTAYVRKYKLYRKLYAPSGRLTIRDIITRSGGVRHSFLQRRGFKANASAFFVISSDKSLCGAYNVNIVNLAMEQIKSAQKAVVITAGSHGETMLRNRGVGYTQKLGGRGIGSFSR